MQIKKITAAAMFALFVLAGCEMATRDNPYDEKSLAYVRAVYVSVEKGDESFPGSLEQPKKTIQSGINRAKELFPNEPSVVRVAEGTYIENSIQMINGVSVLGGYSATWSRNPSVNITIVTDNRTTGGTTSEPNSVFICPSDVTDIDNTILDGFLMNIGAGNYAAGIYCEGDANISNNTITGKSISGTGAGEVYGIRIVGSGAMLYYNLINPGYGNGSSDRTCGIYTSDSTANINSNNINGGHGNSSLGIFINSSTGMNSIIYNNIIDCGSGNSAICITIENSSHPSIDYNEFTNTQAISNMLAINEMSDDSDPSSLTHNNFNYSVGGTVYYFTDDGVLLNAANIGTHSITLYNLPSRLLFCTEWSNIHK